MRHAQAPHLHRHTAQHFPARNTCSHLTPLASGRLQGALACELVRLRSALAKRDASIQQLKTGQFVSQGKLAQAESKGREAEAEAAQRLEEMERLTAELRDEREARAAAEEALAASLSEMKKLASSHARAQSVELSLVMSPGPGDPLADLIPLCGVPPEGDAPISSATSMTSDTQPRSPPERAQASSPGARDSLPAAERASLRVEVQRGGGGAEGSGDSNFSPPNMMPLMRKRLPTARPTAAGSGEQLRCRLASETGGGGGDKLVESVGGDCLRNGTVEGGGCEPRNAVQEQVSDDEEIDPDDPALFLPSLPRLSSKGAWGSGPKIEGSAITIPPTSSSSGRDKGVVGGGGSLLFESCEYASTVTIDGGGEEEFDPEGWLLGGSSPARAEGAAAAAAGDGPRAYMGAVGGKEWRVEASRGGSAFTEDAVGRLVEVSSLWGEGGVVCGRGVDEDWLRDSMVASVQQERERSKEARLEERMRNRFRI